MMYNAGTDEYLKIYPIKTKIKQKNDNGVNKNFQEFQRVYGMALNKRDGTAKEQFGTGTIHKNVRPLIDLKTIRMDMPALGSEQAIIQPMRKPVIPFLKNPAKKVKTEEKIAATSTEQLVKKLMELDLPEKKTSLRDMKKNPNSLVEEANRELNIAAEQLEQIKSIMQSKPAENLKQRKYPTHKLKKKNRHNECVKKKYLSTLSMMQQKLNSLEKKYYNRPSIAYKSVNDTFTQSSDVETIFEKSECEGAKIDQALEGIMTDLDDLMNAGVGEKYYYYEPRDLAFKEQRDFYWGNEGERIDTQEPRRISIHDSSERVGNSPLVDYDSSMRTNNVEGEIPSELKHWSGTNAYQTDLIPERDLAAMVHIPRNCSVTSKANFQNEYEEKVMEMGTFPRKKLSFKKCDTSGEGIDPFSAVIDASESQLKKYRGMKQDIIDVESFCEKMCNLAKDEDQQDLKQNTPVETERNVLDGSQLQSSILRSCYLMKEFDTQPKINYFCEKDSFSRKKDTFADVYENVSGTSVKSLKKLLRNLNSALGDSIYHVIDNE